MRHVNDSLPPISVSSCDACGELFANGSSLPYAALTAGWAPTQMHDGERYLVSLCKPCFLVVLGDLKAQRSVYTMFDDTAEDISDFGQVSPDGPHSVTFGSPRGSTE